jgi:hypothetical protein
MATAERPSRRGEDLFALWPFFAFFAVFWSFVSSGSRTSSDDVDRQAKAKAKARGEARAVSVSLLWTELLLCVWPPLSPSLPDWLPAGWDRC